MSSRVLEHVFEKVFQDVSHSGILKIENQFSVKNPRIHIKLTSFVFYFGYF